MFQDKKANTTLFLHSWRLQLLGQTYDKWENSVQGDCVVHKVGWEYRKNQGEEAKDIWGGSIKHWKIRLKFNNAMGELDHQ